MKVKELREEVAQELREELIAEAKKELREAMLFVAEKKEALASAETRLEILLNRDVASFTVRY